jgi:hypothetical protein
MKSQPNMYIPLFFLIIFFCGCIEDPGDSLSGTITLISKESQGCIQEIPVDQFSDEGILTWQYEEGSLGLFIHVLTHCETKMIDSVSVEEDLITIMLEDTASAEADCICKFRQIYYCRVDEFKEIEVKCFFKSFNSDSFLLVIDRKLRLVKEDEEF